MLLALRSVSSKSSHKLYQPTASELPTKAIVWFDTFCQNTSTLSFSRILLNTEWKRAQRARANDNYEFFFIFFFKNGG